MKYLVILLSLVFIGCDDNFYEINESQQAVNGTYDFEYGGRFTVSVLDNNCIYLLQANNEALSSVNPRNQTLGTHPVFNRLICQYNGSYRYSQNHNYNSGNDLEEDLSGLNISGSKKTDYIVTFQNGQMRITILIYSSGINNNINSVIATREFISL